MRREIFFSLSLFLGVGCREDQCGDGENNTSKLCFAGAGAFAAGQRPFSVAVGDINRDGSADLVTADRNDNTVSVLLGQGDGTFGTKTSLAVATQPTSVTLADFNKDGSLDIAVATAGIDSDISPDNITVLLNNGSGGFGAGVNHPVGDVAVAVVAADFNQDGNVDIAAANIFGLLGETLSTLIGNGAGSFAPQVFSNGSTGPAALTAADLDGDGDTDLAVANSTINQVGLLLNEGGQLFFRNSFAVGNSPSSIVALDIDADGDQDLAVANFGEDTIQFLRNDAAVFTVVQTVTTGPKPQSITKGDFNGDGAPDLAVANQDSNDALLFINQAGTFSKDGDLKAGASPVAIFAADLNGDDISDIAVANQGSNNVSVILSNP